MNHTVKLVMVAVLLFAFCACAASAADDLANGFAVPAESVRPWRYWWWLNGYVTKEYLAENSSFRKWRETSRAGVRR